MKLTKEKVEMFRKFSVCGGITTVEITIKPKKGSALKDFRVYELIPKTCVDDLNKYLVEQIQGDVNIKSDPLIMWHFDELKKEEKVSYKLSKELNEDCMQAIQGLGVSQIKQFCRNSQATGYCQPLSASLSASYSSPQNKGANNGPCAGTGYIWWEFSETLRETSGNVGIKVERREACSRSETFSSGCGVIKTDIVDNFGKDYIPPNGQISDYNSYACLAPGYSYSLTKTYWGTDGNNNPIQASFTISFSP